MWLLVWYVVLAAASTAVVWKGSAVLERSAERLAGYYGIPAVVQGAVIVAIGSSFPELSSVVLAALVHGDFELGVAAIVGSAIFNILVIPGASALAGRGQLQSNRDLVFKEAQFYMISVAVLLLTFSFAVIYHPTGGDRLVGELTRPLALLPIALYGLYVFIQIQDARDLREERETAGVSAPRLWGLLAVGLLVILVGVEGLVRAAIGFGEAFDTPSFFWGLTVVAAGTSIPDAFVSVRSARKGGDVTSLANALGSNVFDLLVAIPVGVLLAGATAIDFELAAPMMGVLTLATVLLFGVMRTDLELTDTEAYALLATYAVFVGWMLLESVGVTGLVL
ncbi:sodium:calcium antiporter [Halorussus salilacus]|uniref:sodium:calcium antiporter n=1 Tax=Halorussus salilacus TaxID=2953750 RepID=UPI0020A1A29E|nr:sodium:calcium antiporter [Halorussus salilacus]USZ67301.1 sodium:calcium antiporter [Halorussus salilacus]